MQYILLVLLSLSIIGSAAADETDLFGGALIAHHPPDIVYSSGEDWCARYHDSYAIDDFADQNPRSDLLSDNLNRDVWYVLAGFFEDKVWCGTQFGLGDYDPDAWFMTSSGNCLANSLEIPTAGWPGPMTGISIAATFTQYSGNFVPVYWFEGYTYSGDPTIIPITEDPSQDFIGFGNCEAPAASGRPRAGQWVFSRMVSLFTRSLLLSSPAAMSSASVIQCPWSLVSIWAAFPILTNSAADRLNAPSSFAPVAYLISPAS